MSDKIDMVISVALPPVASLSAPMLVAKKYVFNPSYEFDMRTELKANIKKYFGYDLTDGDVENMCNALTKNGEVMVNAE